MSIVEELKKQGDKAVQEYIQLLAEEEPQGEEKEQLLRYSKSPLITEMEQNDLPTTEECSNDNYEEDQFNYFASLPKSKTSKCIVCKKINPKYKCPKCKIQYCSIDHYKSHNLFCTEKFFKEQVESQLKATKANSQQKKNMIELLKSNKDQFQSQRSQVDEQTKIQEIGEERLNQLLELIERGEEVELNQNERKCFQVYLKELEDVSEAQEGLQIGESKQEEQHAPFEQHIPFWQIQQGLSQYFTIDQPIQIEQYNASKHKQLLDYRQLSSQLLREDIPKLLQNINFKKTSVFANFQLLQMVYLAALMFRSFNGEYINNKEFNETFMEIYDEVLGKKMAESAPTGTVDALKSNNNVFGLIKSNISRLETKNKEIYQVLRSWLPLVLEDCLTIFNNKYLCLETLYRLLECFKSLNESQQVKWSDEVMNSPLEQPKKKSQGDKRKQREVLKLVKKIQFCICFASEIVYKDAVSQQQTEQKIRTHANKQIIISALTTQLQNQKQQTKSSKSFKQQLEHKKQRTLNQILIP